MMISVVGGGYVGLVTGACFADLGHRVHIVELDEEKVAAINSSDPPIYEPGLEKILSAHIGGTLSASSSYDGIRDSDLTFICVGTPPKQDGDADLTMIADASRSIGEAMKGSKGFQAVAVKSTVPPGTTENLIRQCILEQSGRADVGYAMNPEFLREGCAVEDFLNPDRIVIGSSDERTGDLIESAYRGIDAPIIRTGIMEAEMIKYASNAMLATKISFSNEIGNICKRLGIDVYGVMKGVGLDHRISPHFLDAGAGFGGSCFPKDVAALIRLAENLGYDPALLKSVMQINEMQPLRVIELLQKRLGNLQGKSIAVLGLAFKKDTDDTRGSRAMIAINELLRLGAEIRAYDPMAVGNACKEMPDLECCASAKDALKDADACVIMTEWPEFSGLDKEFNLMRSRVIIEGRRISTCHDVEGVCW